MLDTTASRLDEERAEAARHDVLYRERRPADLRLRPSDWTKFDTPGPALNAYVASVRRLGPLQGKRVLDLGCGDGWFSVILSKRGAQVHGIDISPEAIATARQRAEANDVVDRCTFGVGSGYALPSPGRAYDLVAGQAVLHHLRDKVQLAAELARVLVPGGRAVFAEPFGNSLALERLRRFVPIRSEAEDDPEQWQQQFKYADLTPFRGAFHVTYLEMQCLSRLDRVYGAPWFVEALGRLDLALLRSLPWLRPFARSIVVELTKR